METTRGDAAAATWKFCRDRLAPLRYSRNLNHLWSTGSVVLLWDEPIVEWYPEAAPKSRFSETAFFGRLRGVSTSPPRRRRDLPPRNIHVPAAASPRPASTKYPRPGRGVAATRCLGVSPRRYYPLLQTGVTHLVVNRSTAAAVVDRLEANPAEYKRLVAGAAQIDKHVMSPEGIAEYFFHVLEAIRHHVRYDLVLDDRKDLLELLENTPGACERLVEWKVSSRMVEMRKPAPSRGGPKKRLVWGEVEKGKSNVCETLRKLK